MSNKTLSVIVPVYNVAQFLPKCLETFCIPEIQDDLEVLIINDGSTDESAVIARKYESNWPYIFHLYTKQNGGHGSAINLGIQMATRKYLKVVDGDDWIDQKAFTELLNYLKTHLCDIVATEYCWVDCKTARLLKAPGCAFSGIQYGKIYPFEDICEKIYLKIHNITVRTSILKKSCPPLDEFCFYVDNEFVLYPAPYTKTISFLSETVYMYRIGLTSQSVNIKKMQEKESQHYRVLCHLLEYFDSQAREHLSPKVGKYIANGIARVLASQFKIYLSFKPSREYKYKLRQLDSYIFKYFPEVYYSMQNKAVILLRISHYKLYAVASITLRLMLKIRRKE